jgi:hypothetical protein
MRNENKIPESTDITSILLGLVGVGVAIVVTEVGKEFAITSNNIDYFTLQNTYQLVYSHIPANATDIQSVVNATYSNSLSNLQQATNSIIQTYTITEYLLYFLVGLIILLAIIIKLVKK